MSTGRPDENWVVSFYRNEKILRRSKGHPPKTPNSQDMEIALLYFFSGHPLFAVNFTSCLSNCGHYIVNFMSAYNELI